MAAVLPDSAVYDGNTWFYNSETGQIQHITPDLVAGVPTNPEYVLNVTLPYEIRFATEAQAQAYKKAYPPRKDAGANIPVVGSAVGSVSGVAGVPSPAAVSNTISSVTDALAKLSGLALDLEDGNMWISLGWLAAGVVITVTGLVLLFKDKIMAASAKIEKLAAVAA